MTHEEIIAAVESMTVLELNDLVKAMEEKFGVSAAAPVAMDATGHYVASGTRATVIPVPINEQRLRDLKQTRKLGFNLTLATDNGANNVSIRRNDYLDINAFITVHPQANINIPITNQGLIK